MSNEINLCPTCSSPIKTIPAGVSKKTGKSYESFQACSNRSCGWTPLKRPSNLPNTSKPYKTPHQELLFALREVYALLQHVERQIAEFKEEFEMKRDNTNGENIKF